MSKWIKCSELMPPKMTGVLVATEFGHQGDWRMKWLLIFRGILTRMTGG